MNMMLFYGLLVCVMVVWMALKVARNSVGLGVVTFFFWPLAVIPLVTNWGQRDSDIRLQFFLTLIASVLLWNSMSGTVLDAGRQQPGLTAEEFALANGDDPAFAAQLEREQDSTIALDPNGASSSVTTSARPASPSPNMQQAPSGMPQAASSAVSASTQATESGFAPAPAKVHATPLREIRFRRGDVHLAAAFSSIEIPGHFRFIARHQLGLLSELRDIPVSGHTLGWIVHERVNLNSADFWFVEVQFREVGYLDAPTPAAPPSGLNWNADRMVAQWSQPAVPATRGQDFLAAKLLRHGVLLFRVPELKDADQELGLRVSRLMASRVQADAGWAHAEYVGARQTQSLVAWVQSLQTGAESSVTADAEAGERSS